MADEFQIRTGNWWDLSRNSGPSSSSSTVVAGHSSMGNFGWSSEMVDTKARSYMDSAVSVVSSSSSDVFDGAQKLQRSDYSSGGACEMAADPNLQFMGLGLGSQSMEWNQDLLRSGKAESSFHSLLQEDHLSSNTNYQQESGIISSSQGLNSNYQINSEVYGSSSAMLEGLFGSNNQPQPSSFENRSMNFPYPSNYGMNSGEELSQFPPKQQGHGQIQFTNNAPFWNASMPAMNSLQSNYIPSLPSQFSSTPTFNEKPKNQPEVGDLGTVGKKSNNETSTKRGRSSETPSTMPAFKVRKEKMGDRITALQQLVSPFGKTDTASVLSETIEYIKLLHEQVSVFSTPYMKSGASIHHQQTSSKTKDQDGPKQDLRSRGLCLVPVSSTFPVTHETTVDFWSPTFGATFR